MAIGGYSDQVVLGTDATFQGRIKQAMVLGCDSILNEAPTVAYHNARARFASQVIQNMGSWAPLFTASVCGDANVISDATQANTVALTTGNVAAQAALVTDAHILAALSANFNAYGNVTLG